MKRAVVIPVLFFAAVLAVWQGAVDILAIPDICCRPRLSSWAASIPTS